MPKWFYDCTIDLVGPSSDAGGVTDLQLSSGDGTLTKKNFRAAASVRKEILATALAALASGRTVQAYVDDGPPGGGSIYALQILNGGGGIRFPDGSVQTTASPPPHVVLGEVAGAGGFVSVLRSTGNVGIDDISQNTDGGGFIGLGSAGGQARVVLDTVQLSTVAGSPDNGAVSVTDAAGAAAGTSKVQLAVNANGKGQVTADVKNFRVPNPAQADTDIVYACIEGPEAAAYVRGTAELINGACTIALPDHFATVIEQIGMTVHVTPLSAESLGLTVVEKSPKSLVVQELHQGAGTYSFDWEVKGIRKGYEDYQVIRPQSERSLAQHLPAVPV